MPRRLRLAVGDITYHVLNRRVGRLPLFEKSTDYAAFEKILAGAQAAQDPHRRLLLDAQSLAPPPLSATR